MSTQEPLRVLIIDDSPADQEIYRRLLRENPHYDYEFLEAISGEAGLRLCKSAQPDCVLLDYLLPDLNGIEFLAALDHGREAEIQDFPIIMLTGYGNEMVVAEAMRSGAADYIPKDVLSVKNLERAVTHAVEKHQLRLAVENQRRMLEQTNAELLRKNEEIRTFYHLLSHELKTPLTAAREFVSILLDELAGPLRATQYEYLRIVKDSCDQMTLGLNDLLDVARLDTGKFRLALQSTPLDLVVKRAVTLMTPPAREAEISLHYGVAPDLPEVVLDVRRITQVLTNLLGNAIKFTSAGGKVWVDVTRAPDHADHLLVTVRDNGRGIAAEERPHIFERLYQVRSDESAFEGGLGLGLYICREVVKLHGGEIWVESTPGVGSTFSFTLSRHGVHSTPDGAFQEVPA
jgi:two-component system, sensor histidine kinase and response regulator